MRVSPRRPAGRHYGADTATDTQEPKEPVTAIKRIHPYVESNDLDASQSFYTEVFGLEVAMRTPVICLQARNLPSAQIIISAPGGGAAAPRADFGIDVGDPQAVDQAHARVQDRGLRVVYPLTDEPWGVRRFFVEDPDGHVVNVLAHVPTTGP